MKEDVVAGRVAARIAEMSADQKAYRAFFEKKLRKYGVGSPAELSDEKKKEFFDEVDRDWKADSEKTGSSRLGARWAEDLVAPIEDAVNRLEMEVEHPLHSDDPGAWRSVRGHLDDIEKSCHFIRRILRDADI